MKTISIELSVDSCKKAVKELAQYQKEIKPKLDEVCKRLVEIGIQEAQSHLVLADGNTDCTIEPAVPIDNGYKIVMSGSDVYFVEFGTGDDVATNSYYTPLVAVYPGSWSESHAEKYSTYGFWWYGGEKLTGTPAYMPMYYAGSRMRQELPRIVKEVFGK